MLFAKFRQPEPVQTAAEIGERERDGRLSGEFVDNTARFDNFTLGIRQRQVLQTPVTATVRPDGETIRSQLQDLLRRKIRFELVDISGGVNVKSPTELIEQSGVGGPDRQQPDQQRPQPWIEFLPLLHHLGGDGPAISALLLQ